MITSLLSLTLPGYGQVKVNQGNNQQLIQRLERTQPNSVRGFKLKENSSVQDISIQDCQVQNDGSTWCNYNIDGNLKWACYSDWDGGYCNGDESDDNVPGPN
ncbi:hypothetical protein [Lyngbya confervoides]|uniref:Beta/gamma crystallin 'Greek key' domain-containing protein n=1 Tax=Lyngbya confervoides BDU141951 TaxID=1574623 RepID=A0ABD4T5X2_9CYAN|nr:hypothetical protein [Lyngbya confervoides]MCM1983888.1 hypothetical protein [Lyngbya confervoides BDU141951]